LCETLPTQILIERAREGDQACTNNLSLRLMKHVLQLVRNALHSGLRQRLESRDVMQSIVVKVINLIQGGKAEYRSSREWNSYLKGIAEKKIIDLARFYKAEKRDMYRDIPIDENPADDERMGDNILPPDPDADPTEAVQIDENYARMFDVISKLKPEWQALIISCCINGLTPREVATEQIASDRDSLTEQRYQHLLNKKTDALRMQLGRARAKAGILYRQTGSDGEENNEVPI